VQTPRRAHYSSRALGAPQDGPVFFRYTFWNMARLSVCLQPAFYVSQRLGLDIRIAEGGAAGRVDEFMTKSRDKVVIRVEANVLMFGMRGAD
jgi:hypothetical protein